MSESVLRYLKGAFSGTDRLAANHQLTNLVMGILGRVIIESVKRCKPLEGISIEKPRFIDETTLVAKVNWSPIGISGRAPAFMAQKFSRAEDFMRAKASGLSRACARNPDFIHFINALLERAESYGKEKRIRFKDIRVSSAILDSEDRMVVRLAPKVWLA